MIVHIIRLIDWVDRSIDLPAACLLSELNDDNNQLVSDDSDDEDVEYKGHFCSGCSIPPPGGVRGWVRGYGGVGLWEAGPGCACCEDYD